MLYLKCDKAQGGSLNRWGVSSEGETLNDGSLYDVDVHCHVLKLSSKYKWVSKGWQNPRVLIPTSRTPG